MSCILSILEVFYSEMIGGDYVNSTRTGSQTFRFKDSEPLIFPGGKIAGLRAGIIAGFAYSWPAVEQPS